MHTLKLIDIYISADLCNLHEHIFSIHDHNYTTTNEVAPLKAKPHPLDPGTVGATHVGTAIDDLPAGDLPPKWSMNLCQSRYTDPMMTLLKLT